MVWVKIFKLVNTSEGAVILIKKEGSTLNVNNIKHMCSILLQAFIVMIIDERRFLSYLLARFSLLITFVVGAFLTPKSRWVGGYESNFRHERVRG